MTWIGLVQDALAILVMLGVLFQTPKATGLGGTLGGSSDPGGGYRRRRGLESSLLKFTALFIVLFVLAAALTIVNGPKV